MVILVTQTLNYGKCGPDMGKPREEGAGGPGPLHPMIGRVGGGVVSIIQTRAMCCLAVRLEGWVLGQSSLFEEYLFHHLFFCGS